MLHPQFSSSENNNSPVAIGAIGGSGTRLLSHILSRIGVHMGSSVDPKTWDSLPIREYLGSEFPRLVDSCFTGIIDQTPTAKERFLAAIQKHKASIGADSRWGWKNPRNMWLIPFFAQLFPKMFFILLVRDGRDVALSSNRFLLRTAGHILLAGESYPNKDMAQLALWEKGMRFAMKSGASLLGERFIVIRYEDLCFQPTSTLELLFKFLKVDYSLELLSLLSHTIKPSAGIGRGTSLPRQMIPPSTIDVLESLQYFV